MEAIELVGFDDFDPETRGQIRYKTESMMDKFNRAFSKQEIQGLKLVVKTIKKGGERDEHELIARLKTSKCDFRVEKSGWKILSLIDEMEYALERQIEEEKEKMLKEREGRNA